MILIENESTHFPAQLNNPRFSVQKRHNNPGFSTQKTPSPPPSHWLQSLPCELFPSPYIFPPYSAPLKPAKNLIRTSSRSLENQTWSKPRKTSIQVSPFKGCSLNEKLLVHFCTRLSVGMMLRWPTKRANVLCFFLCRKLLIGSSKSHFL